MNKIYNVKWSKSQRAYVVCSEIAKRAGKSTATAIVVMTACLSVDGVANAQTTVLCTPAADGSYLSTRTVSPECNTIAPSGPVTLANTAGHFAISRKTAGSTLTINDIDITANANAGFTVFSNQYQVGGQVNMGNVKATYNTKENTSGFGTHDLVNINAKNVSLTNTTSYSGWNSSGGVGTYGILAGSNVNSGERNPANNGKFTTVTIDNLDLKQTTSGGKTLPILNSGLRSIQGGTDSNGSSGKIVIKEQLNMTLTGPRLEGIYVSGSAKDSAGVEAVSQAVLNNSNIKIIQTNTANNESSAIKIGKARAVGTGKGAVYSTGTLNIDASEARGDAIKLYDSGSILQADSATSATNVLANLNVIAFGPADWEVPAGAASTGNKVLLNNANLNTISQTASLIKVYQNQKEVELAIKGSDTILTAANNGWLIEALPASSTTVNLADGKYFGLTSKAADASLNINLSDNGTWFLKPKESTPDATVTSTFDNLTMTSGAVLNAANNTTADTKTIAMHDTYSMTLPDGSALNTVTNTAASEFTVKGNVSSTGSTITFQNGFAGDILTIDGNYVGNNGNVLFDTKFGDDTSPTDLLKVTGNTSGSTFLKFQNVDGAGAMTTADGIKVVDVGLKSEDGSFLLVDNAPVMVNGFAYYLYRGPKDPNNPDNPPAHGGDPLVNNDWYLRSVCADGSSTTGGSSTGTSALGCAPNDTIEVKDDAVVNTVEGAGGSDTIHILGNASVTGDILGGGEGQDNSAATDMGDIILVNTTGTIGGKVDGGIGDDLITVTGASTVTGAVIGGLGNDSIVLADTAKVGSIEGNEGDDSIALSGSSTVNGAVDAGDGNDTISVLDTAKVIGDLLAGAGNDTIRIGNNATVATIDAGIGNDTITVSDNATAGAISAGDGDDTFTWSGTSKITSFDGGLGSDVATVTSTGYTGAQILDGGDDTSVADGFIDTLNLNGLTVTANGGNIRNWEVVNLNNTFMNLSGTLTTGKDPGTGLNINTGSTLATSGNSVTVVGNVKNSGTIDLNKNNPAPGQGLRIDGDYLGVAGSRLIVDTAWNNPNAVTSDTLGITGSASGTTQVTVPGGIMGNVTQADQVKVAAIPVVTVGKAHADNVFTGVAATTNAGEAQLVKVGNNYFWTLLAREPGPDPEPGPGPGPGPGPEPRPPVPIRPQAAPAYLLTQYANMEMGFSQLSKLHERVSEQQTWAWDDCGTRCDQYEDAKAKGEKPYPAWARLHLNRLDLKGKERFEVESKTGFLQIGSDLHVSTKVDADGKRSRRHTGAMFTYGWGAHDFYDRNRAVNGLIVDDKYSGKSKTDMWSLGAYSTWYAQNGTYLDLVGNVSYIRNKYQSRDAIKKSQSGIGAAISAEVGRPYQLGDSNWLIEPQAQLSYQMVRLNGFNDGVRDVSDTTLHGLRGRVGARLAWNDQTESLRTKTLYLTANILHDFSGSKPDVKLGTERIEDRMNKTWWEVGLGGQAALSKSTYVYADVRYQRSLGSKPQNTSGPAREGVHGQVGLRYSW